MPEQTCERSRGTLGGARVPCGGPAAYRVTTGCEHEHIRTGLVCVRCNEKQHTSSLYCRRCWDATHEIVTSRVLERIPLTEVA